jgi:lysophospholipase L1-like esterase
MKFRNVWINSILCVLSMLVAFGIGEVVARILAPPPGNALDGRRTNEAHASLQHVVSDAKLLHRLAPHAPGHDARGFRNATSMETADIVAIGDSQTWGINARLDETWPSILARNTVLNVYSMALGGWGPLQYEILANDALALKPRAILVGLYLGNDIFDCCNQTYGTDAYPRYRLRGADFSTALAELRRRLEKTDDSTRLDRARPQFVEAAKAPGLWQRATSGSVILHMLGARGLVPGVPTIDDVYEKEDKAWAQRHPGAASLYRRGPISTVMTYGYRGTAVDLTNPCIGDGLRITGEVMNSLMALGARTGIKLGIVFIPTKESVYAAADREWSSHVEKEFAQLIDHEAAIKTALMDHCEKIGLLCVDAATRLVEAAKNGTALYKSHSDGHPTAEGYRLIAATAQDALAGLGAL